MVKQVAPLPELAYDDLVRICATSCRTPVAAFCVRDGDRYWIKGSHGLDPMIAPLKNTFAARAGYPTTLLVVPDASIDPRFADHLQVVCEGGVRFYAGMPVKLTDNTLIGTISILYSVPRPAGLREDEQQALAALARAIATHLELRRALDALATAQQAALRAARLTAMGSLSATLAHELSQPLGACANYLGVLSIAAAGAPVQAELSGTIVEAQRQLERAKQIIARVRDFARDGDMWTERVVLAEILRSAWYLAEERDPSVRTVFVIDGERTLAVDGDPIQLEQVFINLFRNALEALRGSRNPRVTVQLAILDGAAAVRVEDNGPGLGDTDALKLFEAFQTTRTNGTGLGLALCRTMVEAGGGTISFDPDFIQGAAVLVTLPMARAARS